MNFDAYKINKIFFDQIQSISNPHKYGFDYAGAWHNQKRYGCFRFSLNLKKNAYHWYHSSHFFDRSSRLKSHSYFCKIDQNHFVPRSDGNKYYFLICRGTMKISLRELILFMLYIKHLSNN